MSKATQPIAKAIRAAIVEFKNGMDNANNMPNQSYDAFSLNVYHEEANGKITADVAFCEDSTKTIIYYTECNPHQVYLLWDLKGGSATIIDDIAQAFIDNDWIQTI